MKKIALLLLVTIAFVGCNNDDDTTENVIISIDFSHNWEGTNLTAADFGTTQFTNAHGEVLTISKLRYLISKVTLYNSYGDAIEFQGYQLVDLSHENTLKFAINSVFPPGNYTRMSFVYGFNEADNIDNAYPDLNVAEWAWPDPLGGGYHFMQFEGNYNNTLGTQQPFAYHNGTARVSEGVFEQNFITVEVDSFSIDRNADINIKMDLAEWFKNPNTWDLNTLNGGLMGNYDAQMMMNQNGQNVFSIEVN
jgi:hypothetical protein